MSQHVGLIGLNQAFGLSNFLFQSVGQLEASQMLFAEDAEEGYSRVPLRRANPNCRGATGL